MRRYIGAKEFRQRFSEIEDEVKKVGEIVVLKRSKPIFKIVPYEELPADLLERASSTNDSGQPDLREISDIVHSVRAVK